MTVMENTKLDKAKEKVAEITSGAEEAPRERSMTTLKLQWVAERVRKCRRIKEAVKNGTYHVDSREVAKAILNIRDEDLNVSEEELQRYREEDIELS